MTTKIEWADITINPVVGCSHCSPGCDHCYAERFAARLAKNPQTAKKYAGTVDAQGKWTGTLNVDLSCFDRLARVKKPQRVFVGSMTDVFHDATGCKWNDVKSRQESDYVLPKIFDAMERLKQHTFMLLTKRPENMCEWIDFTLEHLTDDVLPNLWLGVTVCNQDEADEKIPVLLQTPAAKRFVSVEPMLGAIDLEKIQFTHSPGFFGSALRWHHLPHCRRDELKDGAVYPSLDWVICGGETGPGARPMHPDWVRGLRDQCHAAGVPFFFKGWGDWVTENQAPEDIVLPGQSLIPHGWQDRKYEDSVYRVGKRRAGRLLDGREWNEVPE